MNIMMNRGLWELRSRWLTSNFLLCRAPNTWYPVSFQPFWVLGNMVVYYVIVYFYLRPTITPIKKWENQLTGVEVYPRFQCLSGKFSLFILLSLLVGVRVAGPSDLSTASHKFHCSFPIRQESFEPRLCSK